MASSASWIWCFVLVVSSIGSIASASEEKEFVLALDHSNFSDVVSKNDFVVVEFYAPWCGHCKNLAPEYEKAASILNRHDSKVVLAKVDANEEANKDLASQYDVQGFPTLKILRNGGKDIQDYKGPREADGIVEYLKKQSGPASAEIKSDEDAGALIDEKKVVVVGVFPKFSGEEFENFITVAEILRSEYDFGHTKDAKLLPRGESSVTGPVVRLFKPFDELVVDSKDFGVDALEKFVAASSVPTVTIFNIDPNNHPFVIKFFNSQDAKAMLFMNFSDGIHESFKSKYHEVAKQYKGEGISFLMGDLDASKGAFQYFGLDEDQVPLIIIQTTNGQKYLKPHLEPDHLASWVKDFKEGKVEPFKKSEPIPEVNSEPVKVVVGDSIQDMVFNSGKNVLLEFYAPWCGHCKNLAPILEEVALSFQDDADVLIAKLDATANDYPTDVFDVKGYPTMYFRSSNGNIVSYDGDRSKEAIIDFVNQHRSGGSTAQQESEAEPAKDEL